MSVHDDDLLPELRHSTDPVDRRLARLLGRLSGNATPAPHASKALAAFLADSASAPLEPSAVTDAVSTPVDDHVVHLGRTAPRSSPMRANFLVPLNKVLKTGLLAKVMLGTTVALTGVGAAAATGNLPGTGDDNVVVVTPADDSGGSGVPSDEPLGVIDLNDTDDDADEDADDDGPGDDDQGEDEQDDADDTDDDADADADADDEADDDDQGEDADDQGEDADDDQGEDGDDQGEDGDDQGEDGDDQGEDESGADDSDDSGDEDSGDDSEDEGGDD